METPLDSGDGLVAGVRPAAYTLRRRLKCLMVSLDWYPSGREHLYFSSD
jgi:hypothetical protein